MQSACLQHNLVYNTLRATRSMAEKRESLPPSVPALNLAHAIANKQLNQFAPGPRPAAHTRARMLVTDALYLLPANPS